MTIMRPVKSSNIDAVGHNASDRRLTVKFKNGTQHTYDNVSREDYDALVNAKSVGSHFAQHIRNRGGVATKAKPKRKPGRKLY